MIAEAEQAAGQLLSSGEATVTTSRGTLRASLKRPGQLRSCMLLDTTRAGGPAHALARPR